MRVKDSDDVPVILMGTKLDRESEREVSTEEGKSLAASWGAPFLETSALASININEAVIELIRAIPRTGNSYRLVIVGSGGG